MAKSRLDLILDRVKPGAREVTIDTEGYTRDQVDRIIAAAKDRGLHTSYDGRFILIRDLSRLKEAPRRGKRTFEAYASEVEQILVDSGVRPGQASVWVSNHGSFIHQEFEDGTPAGETADRILESERGEVRGTYEFRRGEMRAPNIGAAQRARVEKSLNKMIRMPDGRTVTTREWLDKLHGEGGVVKTFHDRQYGKEEDVARRIEHLGRDVPFGNPDHPATRAYYAEKARLEASLVKHRTGVVLPNGSFFELNKTEIDYFVGDE